MAAKVKLKRTLLSFAEERAREKEREREQEREEAGEKAGEGAGEGGSRREGAGERAAGGIHKYNKTLQLSLLHLSFSLLRSPTLPPLLPLLLLRVSPHLTQGRTGV